MWQVTAARLAWRVAPAALFAAFLVAVVVAGLVVGTPDDTGPGNAQPAAGSGGAGCSVGLNPGMVAPVESLTAEQATNATTIVGVTQALGLGEDAAVIAVMVSLTEASLRNVEYGDAVGPDSRGLFQQRDPWGPLAARMDPVRATAMFLTGGSAETDGWEEAGLLDIEGWQSLTPWMAAQRVQRSGYPTGSNYAANHTLAQRVVGAVTGNAQTVTADGAAAAAQVCAEGPSAAPVTEWTPLPGDTPGERAVNAAARWDGIPYAWGGGTRTGPSQSIRPGETQVGFDCSGLILHAWWQAARVDFPHSSVAIAAMTQRVTKEQARAGDILSFDTAGGGRVSHDGLYDGRGGMWHAPRTGKTVEYIPDVFNHPYYAPRLLSVTRPTAANQVGA